MHTLVQAALDMLPAVIDDLQAGINSRHGYKAWFKSNTSKDYIQRVLQNIHTVQSKFGLQPQPDLPTGPHFSCVGPNTSALYPWMRLNPFYLCVTLFPGMKAFYYPGSSYILICPSFWSLQPWPSITSCPTVMDNLFVGSRAWLSDYQTYVLIHEMVHFYLGMNSLTLDTAPREQYELNDCVALGKVNSFRNPANYQHYLASKL